MKTIEQRIAAKQGWSTNGLAAHIDLEVKPFYQQAQTALDLGQTTVILGLRNRKRTKTVKLALGVTGAVSPGGYSCTVDAADLLTACEDELAAVHALLSGAVAV
jgi:hypothetical protein